MDAFAARIERDVIHVEGDDTIPFLQGQLSQDVAALAVGASAWTLLLEPNGKVTAWLRATRVGERELLLDTDPGAGAAAVARLERFKLRTRCTLHLDERQPAVAVRGRPRSAAGLPIAWPGVDGEDLLGPSAAPPAGLPVVDAAGYEAARIVAGVPVSGVDIGADTIPAEAGQWLIDASVSFTKGCYTGQELVARVDSRGANVPRPLRCIEVAALAVAPGAPVTDADGHDVGRVTSAAPDPAAGVTLALGPVQRSIAPGAAVLVDGHPATVLR